MTKPIMKNNSKKISNINNEIFLLIGCVLLSAFILLAQIVGSKILIIIGLIIYVLFHCYLCFTDYALCSLLFFLPWSTLLKMQIGGVSFFTICLALTCVIFLIKSRFKFELYQIVFPMAILALTLVAKTIQFNQISRDYIFFIMLLVLFPNIAKIESKREHFYSLTMFFALGLIMSSLTAKMFSNIKNVSQFIRIDSYSGVTRFSGYYPDPNFYSALVTACLAGMLLVLLNEKQRLKQIVAVVFSFVLLYCGMISVSKAFILVAAVLVFVTVITLAVKGSKKERLILLCLVLLAFAVVGIVPKLRNLFMMVLSRFSNITSLSALTTHRSDLWKQYFEEFLNNPSVLLLGQGYTQKYLIGWASHNSIIQGIFQFGVFGFPLLLAWLCFEIKKIFAGKDYKKINAVSIILFCIGVFLPWMALDILFFDEFFILPVYAAIGVLYASDLS